MRNKNGFTLIELVVTMAVSGIFFTLAMNMYCNANGAFINYKKSHEAYFDYNVKKATASRMLKNNSGKCENDGTFHFSGDAADSLNNAFPFPAPKCKSLDRKRILVYFLGVADSSSKELLGYSEIYQE